MGEQHSGHMRAADRAIGEQDSSVIQAAAYGGGTLRQSNPGRHQQQPTLLLRLSPGLRRRAAAAAGACSPPPPPIGRLKRPPKVRPAPPIHPAWSPLRPVIQTHHAWLQTPGPPYLPPTLPHESDATRLASNACPPTPGPPCVAPTPSLPMPDPSRLAPTSPMLKKQEPLGKP